jgi:hypothetical protein
MTNLSQKAHEKQFSMVAKEQRQNSLELQIKQMEKEK